MRARDTFAALLGATGLALAATPASAQEPAGALGAYAEATITDDHIADIVLTVNSQDSANAMLALDRTENDAVRSFANDMVVARSGMNLQVMRLARDLGLIPSPDETTKTMEMRQTARRDELRKLEGAEFDRAYAANEVDFHQRALKTMDELLIPNAGDPKLKSALEGMRPAFAAHLGEAEELREKLEDQRTAMSGSR